MALTSYGYRGASANQFIYDKAVGKPPCFYKAVDEGDKDGYEHRWLTLRSVLLVEILLRSRACPGNSESPKASCRKLRTRRPLTEDVVQMAFS